MLLWLIQHFGLLRDHVQSHTTGDSRVFLTGRTAAASVTSFLIALLLGPIAIRLLKRRFRERIDSASERLNELHADKNDTPTMGGLFVMGSVLLASVLWADLTNTYVLTGVGLVVSLTMLGAVDDWIKMSTARKGLSVRQKLAAQIVLTLIAAFAVYYQNSEQTFGTDLVWPIGRSALALGPLFILWAVIVLVGSSNAVNLTDGLDGLATGCTIFAGSAFVGLTYLCGHKAMAEYLSIPHIIGSGELTIMMGSLVGAMLGFLWFNCYPAQVFMGDAGSLPIGGLLGLAALVTRQEILLVIVGGVFVIETLSVILQVGCFRLTGKRLILCSPLHNHFLFRGDHEIKIVTRFWIGSALLAIIGIASLKLH
jgi:phospho-N-acetylmuramoyl-pentapeptide-transferase